MTDLIFVNYHICDLCLIVYQPNASSRLWGVPGLYSGSMCSQLGLPPRLISGSTGLANLYQQSVIFFLFTWCMSFSIDSNQMIMR